MDYEICGLALFELPVHRLALHTILAKALRVGGIVGLLLSPLMVWVLKDGRLWLLCLPFALSRVSSSSF
jgi:hypothetical protein